MRYAQGLAALLGVAALANGARADDAGVHLILHGHVDSEAVRAELETELGADVELVRGACGAPCVDVSVEGTTATVLFSPRQGTVRERTVELGRDPEQWPTVITLLAGNLVRDEAADVLAQLPPRALPAAPPTPYDAPPALAPPLAAPAPALAPPPADPEVEHRAFELGLVPMLSTDFAHVGSVRHHISIDLVAGYSGGSTGLSLSGVVDAENGPVSGFQIAGAAAYARSVSGTQIGGAAAVAGDLHGVQIAGAAAVAARSVGVQVAGALAVSGASANVQVAGGVTVADRVSGVQIAPINIANRVDGVQVGVVNIGGGNDGISIGLVNIVRGGRTDLETALDSDGTGTILLRHGSRRWHNAYGIGGQHVDRASGTRNNDVWMYGLGFGPTWRVAGGNLDVDALCWHVNHGHAFEDKLSLWNQLRVSYAHPLGPVSLVVGAAYNVYVTTDHASPVLLDRRAGAAMDTGVSTLLWPSAFVGVRL